MNNSILVKGHHEFDQSDFHSNLHNEVKTNKSSHSSINQRTSYEISNITRQTLTTNETIHNQQQNIGKTKSYSLIC